MNEWMNEETNNRTNEWTSFCEWYSHTYGIRVHEIDVYVKKFKLALGNERTIS